MKNKHIIITIVLFCIVLAACKKANKPELFTITEVEVDALYTDAHIYGSYSFNDIPKDMRILYGKKDDMTDAAISKVSVDDDSFDVKVTDLEAATKYYYRFECYASHSSTRSEVHSFSTLKTEKPIVETSEINNITINSAIGGGKVVSSFGAEVTTRGVCWSTSQNPTTDNNEGMTTDGSGMGFFTSNIPNLAPNTKYYVRAYATNAVGTGYGNELVFTTFKESEKPIVKTSEVSDVVQDAAICGGEVVDDGGAPVTARGVCWSTNQNPTIDDNEGMTTDGSGMGIFTSNIQNLAPNTQYYVRAYAINEMGTSYGEEESFTVLEESDICEPDGEIDGYDYVDLGLPSGLKWATYNIGATTPEGYGDYFAWGETETKEEYTQENSVTDGLTISQLQSQGYIDGEGNLISLHDAATANWGGSWRMPTEEEMQELLDECTWTWTTQNGVNGYKVTGPNGSCIFLPAAGFRNRSSLYYAGEYGHYWSSTPNESYISIVYYLYFYSDYQSKDGLFGGYNGQSVRPVSE